jgi:hypothetical protein
MPEGPERSAKIEAENASHRARSREIAVKRNVVHEGVIKQANREVMGGSKNVSNAARQTAGTKVTDPNHRGMNGDFDAGGGYRTTEKIEKILGDIGVKSPAGGPVKMKNGVLETSGNFGMTVNPDVGVDRVGSAGHQAQVRMGATHGETYVSETGGAVQSKTLKDHLATLDHSKKAMHGLNENPKTLVGASPEGQAMAKGALKAADQAGLAPKTVEAIARQNGIKNPENLMEKLAEIKTGRATITSAEEAAKLQKATRDILNASEASTKARAAAEVRQTQTKISDLEAKGNMQEAQKLRRELADYRAKAKASSGVLAHPEKGVAGGGREPFKTSSTTEPTVKTGKTMSGEPETKAAGSGRMMRGAGLALGAYGIYEGYQTASKEMSEKKQGEPKGMLGWTSSKAELAARTLWHGLGFGGMAEIGTKAGKESFEQYKKDIADGKVSKDSISSSLWMEARGVMSGLYGGAKAITYDAAERSGTSLGEAMKEGAGAGKDLLEQLKGAYGESKTNEERSKKVYDMLIKNGASTIGAQRAADAVKNGDFTEAKRLTKILNAKREAKDASAQKVAETENGEKTRSSRDRKKAAIKKKAQKQEQVPREQTTDEQLKMREIVTGKLLAKGLPTGTDLVDRLVSVLEKEGLPALETAISEMTSMQGTFTGSVAGKGTLQITVKGTKVTGSYTAASDSRNPIGPITMTIKITTTCTLKGDVELSSGTISMKMSGTTTVFNDPAPIAASLSGSFTGKGYKGSASGEGGSTGSSSWSVSR